MKFFTTLVLFLLAFSPMMNAQNGYTVADAIPVTSFPTTFTNVQSSKANNSSFVIQGCFIGSSTGTALGSAIVYKITTVQEGSLNVIGPVFNPNNYAGGIMAICTTNVANPDFGDLILYNTSGNTCNYARDTAKLGHGYRWWHHNGTWTSGTEHIVDYKIPAGDYYLVYSNENKTETPVIDDISDITIRFAPYCEGIAHPVIEVEGNSVVIADADRTPSTADYTDYGGIVSGASAISKTFTIKNTDPTTALNISSVNITGANAANFSVTSSPASTVATNSSTTMTVQFSPNTVGENTATIEITSDDCVKLVFDFDLRAFVLNAAPSDKRGNMMTFNGIDDYVEIDAVAAKMDGETEFTFEGWIYVDPSQGGKDQIISVNTSSGGNVVLFYIDAGKIVTYDGSGDTYLSPDLRLIANQGWHHVAFTHNNSKHKVYLDGVLLKERNGSVSTFAANNKWSIGQEFDGGLSKGDYFHGKMDEIRIWKDVRTEAEIKASMNLSFTMADIASLENLVAYYQFDNDAAAETADGVKDVLGNHGTSIGCTYSASEVAVGNGISETQTVNAAGTYHFSTVGVELEFITSNGEALPNGDIIITKLTTEGAKNVSGGQLANKPETYWVIRNLGTNAGLNCNVKMKFDDGSIDDNLTANHKVHKRGSNQFDTGDWTDLTPSSVDNTSGNNHITVNVTSFSQFAPSSSTSDFVATLPVELISFNAIMKDDNQVELTWRTANELNNEGFEIERLNSNNGKFE
ncbi:MAG: LamG-like jellyroll fold domain-containing protein, partial [Saprospiraceae bacterium]